MLGRALLSHRLGHTLPVREALRSRSTWLIVAALIAGGAGGFALGRATDESSTTTVPPQFPAGGSGIEEHSVRPITVPKKLRLRCAIRARNPSSAALERGLHSLARRPGCKRFVRPPPSPPPSAPSGKYRHKARVCFTARSLHLYGGEGLAAINQRGQGNVGISFASIARQSFAPNIRAAIHRLEKFGDQDAVQVISAASRGLERVLQEPKLLLDENTDQLHRAFSRAQRLAEQSGFSKPNCLY
jgi:hypothetical protein